MITRVLTPSDFTELLAIDRAYVPHLQPEHYHHEDMEAISECLTSGLSLGLFDGEALAGYRLSYLPGLNQRNLGHHLNFSKADLQVTAQLYGTMIKPIFRRQGFGEELMRQSLTLFQKKGIKNVLVTVHPENFASRQLCQKCGFIARSEISFFGLPRVLYALSLRE